MEKRRRLTASTLQKGEVKLSSKDMAPIELVRFLKYAYLYAIKTAEAQVGKECIKQAANDIYDLSVTAPKGQNDPQLGYVNQTPGGGVSQEQLDLMVGVSGISKKDIDTANEVVFASS